jgi:hypothetical protein
MGKGVDLAIHSFPLHERGFSLAFALRNYFVQFEDWQEHRDHNSANDHSEEHNQNRLN